MSTQAQAMQAQSEFEPYLLAKPNVVGVGVGFKEERGETQGDLALVVLVEQKKPLAALEANEVIPREVDGMRTDVYEVGQLRAQQTPRERFRPLIPGGVSIGHFKVTAGTFGALVKDRATGEVLVLSNNHVLAYNNEAQIGDNILQPGTMDGGVAPGDVVAKLERFVKLRFLDEPPDAPPTGGGTPNQSCDVVSAVAAIANAIAAALGSSRRLTIASAAAYEAARALAGGGIADSPQMLLRAMAINPNAPTNQSDCAVARPVDPAMFSDIIRHVGVVNQTTTPTLGMRVGKYGRTTAYTEANITLLNATVNITYSTSGGRQRVARFVGQVISEAMSEGGDSGSLVVNTADRKAVGLLFAGSPVATIFTPIDVVLNALNVRL
jgi:hypothetical protein